MTKLEFAETVATVCKRPAAYTLHDTLPEVLAYLNGMATQRYCSQALIGEQAGFSDAWKEARENGIVLRDDDKVLVLI